MKNPKNKTLKIVWDENEESWTKSMKIRILQDVLIAESNLVRAGKDSAMPHFLATMKEIERLAGFKFEFLDSENPKNSSELSVYLRRLMVASREALCCLGEDGNKSGIKNLEEVLYSLYEELGED